MNTNNTGIYLVTFTMNTPVNSQTGWGEKAMERGILVTSQMAKIGKFENGEEGRRKNYQMTYGTFFQMQIMWSGNVSKEIIRNLESAIKKEFKEHRYRNPLTKYPTEYIDLTKITLQEVQQKIEQLILSFLSNILR